MHTAGKTEISLSRQALLTFWTIEAVSKTVTGTFLSAPGAKSIGGADLRLTLAAQSRFAASLNLL